MRDARTVIRITHIISGDLWAGAESQLETLFRAFRADADFQLSAIILNHGELETRLTSLNFDVSVISEQAHTFPALVAQIRQQLAKTRPHIIHSHRYKENLLASLGKAFTSQSKLIQTVHGTQELFQGWHDMKACIYRAIDFVNTTLSFSTLIAVSNDLHQVLSKRYPSKNVCCIHNAVDDKALQAQLRTGKLRAELDLKPETPLVGFCGRLVPIKGIEVLLQALAQTQKQLPTLHCAIIGTGPLENRLRELSAELGIASVVHFLGHRNNWPELIADLDLVTLPSLHEGIPMTLLEAMAGGRTCIASRVGGIPDVIEDRKTGLLVPAQDPTTLASTMLEMLADPLAREQIGKNAQAHIEKQFSLPSLHDKMRACYFQLVGENISA